ncbi:MAG TPA: hypothetical protein VJ830_02330 [Anaerolineales bacterium]|nr:hypothetical protein [Anaerolineales bacterium]
MIRTELTLVGVAGGFVGGGDVAVNVGSGVKVAVGGMDVDVGLPVGAGVNVGNGLGTENVNVGKGVSVGMSKLNKGVGVGCVPAVVGKTFGLGTAVDAPRDPKRSTLIGTEHRQQNTNTESRAKRILPVCPCRL